LIRNKIWAQELGRLVDAVGAFPDIDAMNIMRKELSDLLPRISVSKQMQKQITKTKISSPLSQLQKLIQKDPILSLFEFYNDGKSVASASIGQVYKARIRRGPALESAIGVESAAKWGGKLVAIKIQRPDAQSSASLDMYLIRRAAMWLSMLRGGDLPAIADQFGMQLFGELDYVREANNCYRFRELYDHWEDIQLPSPCNELTRKKVLVMDWINGEKGPWGEDKGIQMVRTGLKCSVNQLMSTGLFHADPHR
jgi:predicted unusual protein kinase regulating ubiquinone biosynthesis (AarF/ABC1/UbiB family)